MSLELPTYFDIVDAAGRLAGQAKHTPIVGSPLINAIAGVNVYLKNETAQKTGSFKYRGAYSRLSAMSDAEKAKGIVAFSSGNHAQGVALAAKELGIDAVIVMPTTAPKVKTEGTRSHGAKIIAYNPLTESREAIAADIAAREGRTVVPSFDDKYIIAGQGTCGLEIAQAFTDLAMPLDAVIMPIGGGGLCAGISLAIKQLHPQAKIYGAEPEHYDDHYRSLKSGQRERNEGLPDTVCDALLTPSPGELTFAINRTSLSGVLCVSDEQALLTSNLLHSTLGLRVEPSGAAALAAILSNPGTFEAGSNIAAVLSGGNVDDEVFELALALDAPTRVRI